MCGMFVCACELKYLQRWEKGIGASEAGVSAGFELPGVDAGNWIQVLFKKYSI